jgi:predicted DCC family thiol-disulfide oxidoreductase YuxK
MPIKPNFPLRVFYDGSCFVCSTEIEHYLGQDHGGKLLGVDISTQDFDAGLFGMPLDEFMFELHAIDSCDRVYRGVEAFWAIWQAFPAATVYGLMGAIITMPLVNPAARLLYRGFARIRRYLPKRHTCSSGTCRIDGKKL